MLVKVVLSYYMEGEHSQGANQSKGVWSGGEWSLLKGGGRGAAGHVLTCGRVAVLGPLRGPARKTRRTLAWRARCSAAGTSAAAVRTDRPTPIGAQGLRK